MSRIRPQSAKRGSNNLLLWLLLLGILFAVAHVLEKRLSIRWQNSGVLQPMAAHDRSATVHLDDLAYLNRLRVEAGLQPYSHSPALAAAAGNHARYLLERPEDGHYESERQSMMFTGHSVGERARYAGYRGLSVEENLSTMVEYGEGAQTREDAAGSHRHVDELMTALYHRLSLLGQQTQEAGAAFAVRDNVRVLVFNQGSQSTPSVFEGREYVVYPVGNDARPYYYDETPDPMPDREFSGNPVSIAFHPQGAAVRLSDFRLYLDGNIVATRLLDERSDPNGLLSDKEFALFPLHPLEHDREYRAYVRYEQNGREQEVEWTFRTKRPDYPYFLVKGGEKLAVENGKTYFIRWSGEGCRKECSSIEYQTAEDADLVLHEREPDGVVVEVSARSGSRIELAGSENRRVTLYVR